jgi:hypothetical protein
MLKCINKDCKKRGELQPESNFYKHQRNINGRDSTCIGCRKKQSLENYYNKKSDKGWLKKYFI